MEDLLNIWREFSVIGALRTSSWKDINDEELSWCPVFFFLEGNVFTLREALKILPPDLHLFLHLDLFGGIASDESGLLFMRETFPQIRGIISTRARTLNLARKAGFLTIFRLFLIDSESLRTGLRIAQEISPDALEILPGIIFPQVRNSIPVEDLPPLICGGFIRKKEEVEEIISRGAVAVSTSCRELWKMNRR
ncbi:MAG TPA: glycerol-3-phosphate responsive antiterminator [Candidatus Atribacteria bacterium]|nr:glycerol-3-phosphate responsive antiterminator [Candidatus Atribacteria bacterium]